MKTNWQIKKLGDVCDVVGGGTPKTGVSEYWDGDLCWVTPKDLGQLDHFEISETERKITEEGLKNSSAQKLPIGSVILSSRAPIGYVVINTVPMATNQGCRSFICGPEIFNKYLYYFLISSTELLNSLGSGSTFLEISGSRLKELEIPLPPLDEQKEIVAKLDEKFAKLREAKQLREEAIADADRVLSATLREIFNEGKEKGWEDLYFGNEDYLKIIDGDRGKNYPTKAEFTPDGYCLFLNTSNVRKGNFDFIKMDFITKEKDESLRKGKLSRGDVILTTRGTLGNSAYYDDSIHYENVRINSGMVVLRTDHKKVLPQYLIYIINSNEFIKKTQEANSGSAQPQLPIKVLSKLSFPLPPLTEQKEIVTRLDTLSEKLRTLRELQQSQLADLKKLEKAYLREAFNGELS